MENFDEFMRQKYDSDDPAARFEFREEYWEQALVLIEADEARRKKKRRRFFWWFFFAAFLAGAGAAWFYWAKPELKTTGMAPQGNSTPSLVSETQSGNRRQGTENEPPAAAQIENQPEISPKQTSADLPDTHSSTPKTAQKTSTSERSNTRTIHNQTISPAHSATDDKSPERRIAVSEKSVSKAKDEPEAPGLARPGQATPPSAPEILIPAPHDNLAPREGMPMRNSLDLLLLPMRPVETRPRTPVPPRATLPMADNNIKPHKDPRWNFGLTGTAALYPPAPDLRRLGGALEGSVAYRWRPQWSVALGLGLRFQPGQWSDSSFVEQTQSLKFSFGYNSVKSDRRALGLVSLELPALVQWQKGAWVLEAGAAPGRLIYALERYEETRSSSLQPAKTKRNRLERGDTEPYGAFYVNTLAGAKWRCSRNLALTLHGRYRLGNLVKATDEAPAVRGGAGLDLGLSWLLR